MPSRASATATPLRFARHLLEDGEHLRVRARRPGSARSAAMPLERRVQLVELRGHARGGRRRRPSASARELGLGALDGGGQLVGLEHPLEDLVFERLDLALREADLLAGSRGIPRSSSPPSPARGTSTAGPGGRRRPSRVAARAVWFSARRSFAAATRWRAASSRLVERLLALGLIGERGASASAAAESSRWRAIRRSRSAFIMWPKKRPRRSGACHSTRCGSPLPTCALDVAICALRLRRQLRRAALGLANLADASEGWWAHQDSNLERAGYEPAALTVELWARQESKHGHGRQS